MSKKDKKNLEMESQNVADVVEALEAETDSLVEKTESLETTVEDAPAKKISKKDKKKDKKKKKDKLVEARHKNLNLKEINLS